MVQPALEGPKWKLGGWGTVGVFQPETARGTGGLSEPRDTLNLSHVQR